jgi:hypothetical protein
MNASVEYKITEVSFGARRDHLLAARTGLLIVSVGLILSGLTCYFLPWELETLVKAMAALGQERNHYSAEMYGFLVDTGEGVMAAASHPQLFLGTDYLGFAHVLFAILFLGALRDPARNLWVVKFGVISSALVVPAALLFGWMRGAPMMHRFVDASFGVVSLGLMVWTLRSVQSLARRTGAGA